VRQPERNDVAIRARILSPSPVGLTAPEPAEPFLWVHDVTRRTYEAVPVNLVRVSKHADWYVEKGRDPGDLDAAVEFLETRGLPGVTRLTGATWSPGAPGQPRLAIFHGRVAGVAGYMSAYDALPRTVFPYSNERPTVYLGYDARRIGGPDYNNTLTHELEHLAHFSLNPHQEGWLDEGLAELVSNLVVGASARSTSGFRARPDVQLNTWSQRPGEAGSHYQASYLWAAYLMERAGGPDALPDLLQAGGRGLETAARFARQRGLAEGAEPLFKDWLVANLVADPSRAGGPYGYRALIDRVTTDVSLRPGDAPFQGEVHQFAGDYLNLEIDRPVWLRVELAPTVRLIDSNDTRGAFFWSGRGDSLDAHLTRSFDLTPTPTATLTYRLWHDLEGDYDFCYALGTRDGTTWTPLAGRWTTDRNPTGVALGPGYSGRSGDSANWREEVVDLSMFAGGRVWLRFECLTDQGYSGPGFAVDDVSIPEIGFHDDAEQDLGWVHEGFLRIANLMTQPAAALLVEQSERGISVLDIPIDQDGRGALRLNPSDEQSMRRTLILAGLAPMTMERMRYRVALIP
jgi:hypothetical protein